MRSVLQGDCSIEARLGIVLGDAFRKQSSWGVGAGTLFTYRQMDPLWKEFLGLQLGTTPHPDLDVLVIKRQWASVEERAEYRALQWIQPYNFWCRSSVLNLDEIDWLVRRLQCKKLDRKALPIMHWLFYFLRKPEGRTSGFFSCSGPPGGSNSGPETDYFDWGFSWFSSVVAKMPG